MRKGGSRRPIALAAAALAWFTVVGTSAARLANDRPARKVGAARSVEQPAAPTTIAPGTTTPASTQARAGGSGGAAGFALPIPQLTPPGPTPPATMAPTSTSGEVAYLRLGIDTTSDWTAIRFGGAVGGVRVVRSPANVAVAATPDGVALRWVPVGGASVTVDLALDRGPGDAASTVTVEKGWLGSTTVRIENRSAAPALVATVTNDRQTTDDPNNAQTWSVPSTAMFSATTALRRTGERPRVLAFYYPWFEQYGDPRLADRPSQPRSVQDVAGVTSMLTQARANGIDGFVQSWAGASHDGAELGVLLDAAARTGATVSLYLETVSANALRTPLLGADGSVVTQWLREGLDQAAASPAFLRDAAGTPVVFVYEMSRLSPSDWAGILASLGRPVRLVGDTADRAYETVAWGVHRYNPNIDGGEPMTDAALATWDRATAFETRAGAVTAPDRAPRLFAATVSPGFDNRPNGGALYVDRGPAGEHYQATWDAALASDPDWILVTSWNEWYEGTAVEPSVRFGDLALRQTADNAAAWKAAP